MKKNFFAVLAAVTLVFSFCLSADAGEVKSRKAFNRAYDEKIEITIPDDFLHHNVMKEVAEGSWDCGGGEVKWEDRYYFYFYEYPGLSIYNADKIRLVGSNAEGTKNQTNRLRFDFESRLVKIHFASQECWQEYEFFYDEESGMSTCKVYPELVCDSYYEIQGKALLTIGGYTSIR